MKKIYLIIICFMFLNSCFSQKTKKIEFISYGHSLIPDYNYENLTSYLLSTDLIDSLKVIGHPLTKSSFKFEIDTLKVNQVNVSIDKLTEKIKNFDFNKDKIETMEIENRNGEKVALQHFVSMSLFSEYKKPEIFIPEPKYFLYEGETVAKFEIYYNKTTKKQLNKIIQQHTSKEQLKIKFIN